MNKTIKNIGCSILATVMGCSLVNFPLFAQENDEPATKTETVYTVLNDDGTVNDTIVSSWLHDDNGINNIKEELDLKDVENVKGDEQPKVSGKEYTWNVKGNDVYYQGKTNKQLPISIKIQYKLDGKTISAKDLEGKSGKLEMNITFTNNISEKINANGKEVTIHPSYLAGGTVPLDSEVFTNVKCSQGKIISDGSNEILTFATVPGLSQTLSEAGLNMVNEKLDLSDTVTIKADVKNYQQPELLMAATNELDAKDIEGVDSVSDLTGGINELISASEQINEGTHELADGASKLNDGISQYTDGVSQAKDGGQKLSEGTSQLKEGISPLASAGNKVDELADGATQLYNGSVQLNEGLKQYTDGVSQVNSGAVQVAQGTDQLKEGIAPLASAYPQIDQLIEGSQQLAQGSVNLQSGLKEYTNGVAKLNEGNKQLSGIEKALSDTKQGSSSLVEGSKKVSDGLTAMNAQVSSLDMDKINQLSANLNDAKQGLDTLAGIVKKDQQTLNTMSATVDQAKAGLGQVEALLQDINAQAAAMNETIAENNQKISDYNASANAASQNFEATRNAYVAQIDSAIAALQTNQVHQDYQVPVTTTDADGKETVTYETRTVDVDFSAQIAALEAQKSALQSAATPTDLQTLTTLDPTQLNSDFATMKQSLDGMSTVISSSTQSLDDMSADIAASQQIITKMETLLSSADLGNNINDLSTSVKQLQAGLAQLETGSNEVSNGITRLDQGLGDLEKKSNEAIAQLQAGSQQLTDNSEALNDGAAQLAQGTKQLADQKDQLLQLKSGLGQLTSGVDQLNNGSNQLAAGLNELDANSPELKSGSQQLLDGANKLRDGSDQFQEQGMGQLKEKLDLTTGELNTFMDIIDHIEKLNEENSTFAGAPENVDSTVRFVYRTVEEQKDEK